MPLACLTHKKYVKTSCQFHTDMVNRFLGYISAWLFWIIVPSFVMKSFPQTCFFSMFVVSSIILGLSYILLKNFYFLLKNGHGQSHSWIFKNNVVVHFMAKGMGIAGIVIWNDLNIFIFVFFPPCKYIRVSCWSEGDDFGKVAEVHFFFRGIGIFKCCKIIIIDVLENLLFKWTTYFQNCYMIFVKLLTCLFDVL